MRLLLVVASLALLVCVQAGGGSNACNLCRQERGRTTGSGRTSGSGSVSVSGSASGGGLLSGLLDGLVGQNGLVGGLLGENGLLGNLLSQDGVLGTLGQTLQNTLSSVGEAVGDLVEQVLQLVLSIVQRLAAALSSGVNVSGAIASSAVELVANLRVEELGRAVLRIATDLPSLDVTRLVIQIAINLSAEDAARFLLDVRRLIPAVDLGQVLASLSVQLGVSSTLDIALVLAARLELDISVLLSGIIETLPVNVVQTFVDSCRARFGTRLNVDPLACRAVSRLRLRC